MKTPKTLTEMMAEELREAEEVLGFLDQRAVAMGPALSRAYHRWYQELLALRDSELREWNEQASCGLRDRRRMLYRCEAASMPYHTPEEGPCEVYTPNYEQGVSLCTGCQHRAYEKIGAGLAAEIAADGRKP